MKLNKIIKDFLIIALLVVIAVLFRTVWHLAPNFEMVTVVSVLAVWVLDKKHLAILVPLLSMIVSDLIIGNSFIFIFTWSGFLLTPVLALLLKKFKKFEALAFIGSGVLGTIFFYLWTNFGVVLIGDLYPLTLDGIFRSYVNALPFLRTQLLGNVVMLISVYLSVLIVRKSLIKLNESKDEIDFTELDIR